MIRKEKRATWRYVMSGSWPLILSQDLQLWMTVRWWGSSQAFTLSVAHTLKNDTDYSWAEVFFLSEYLCSAVSFHNIPPFFTFWFLVPFFFGLLHSSTVFHPSHWFFRSRASGDAETAPIVSICATRRWSHRQSHASLGSSTLARLHQLRSCC